MNPIVARRGELPTADEVVRSDCEYICSALEEDFRRMSGQRLLITGGAGFLGHYLVNAVLHWNRTRAGDRPIHVTVFDNYQRGFPSWLKRWIRHPHLSLVTYDITEPLPGDMEHFDWIVHAASIASPAYYRRNPIETADANVLGLRQLLDYTLEQRNADRPISGFLFFSSSEVYGDPEPDAIPTPETYRGVVSFIGPRACYDESKRYGETLSVLFARVHDLPVKIVRPFNNYGPGLKLTDRRVLPDFARDILANRDIRMLSDGSPTRTFCYVADAVIGYYRVLVRGRPGEPYNIGVEGPEVSMAEFAEQVAHVGRDLLGYRGQVIRARSQDPEYLTDSPNRRCPDISKARADLAYGPSVDLDEGLRRSLLWYVDRGGAKTAAAPVAESG